MDDGPCAARQGYRVLFALTRSWITRQGQSYLALILWCRSCPCGRVHMSWSPMCRACCLWLDRTKAAIIPFTWAGSELEDEVSPITRIEV